MNRDILRLALPSIVSNITVPLLGMVDVAIMGHIGNELYIAAIAVGSMVFNVIYWILGFLRAGTSGLTAQAYGRATTDEASAEAAGRATLPILRQSLVIGLVMGLLIVVLQLPLRHVALWLMGPEADVTALVTPYYNTCVWGAPAVLGLFSLTGWFIGMQDTRTPMWIAIGQNIVNILVSTLLVFNFHMGIVGVAIGTLTAQWLAFLVALMKVYRTSSYEVRGARSVSRAGRTSREALWEFFRVNRDLFLRTVLLVSVLLFFTSAGARQGAMMLAVNTLLMQLFTIFSYFMDGFAYAGEALTGRYYGAGDRIAEHAVVRDLFRWGWAMVAVFTLLYWIGGQPFLSLLTSDGNVVSAAAAYRFWYVLIPLCGMAAFVWDGIFVGITESRGLLVSCAVATVAFYSLWWSLQSAWGNDALWLAFLVFLLLRGTVQTYIYVRRTKLA